METDTQRKRVFPNFAMPDQQHPNSGFPGSNFLPNDAIWNNQLNTRDHTLGPRGSEDSTWGSSGLNAKAGAWPSNNNPWNRGNPNQAKNTSPVRTRDATTLLDHSSAMNGGRKNGFATGGFHGDTNGFAPGPSQRRGSQDPYLDSVTGVTSRDPNQPQSRQSQGSPGFSDYLPGHTPSHSAQLQRQAPGHSASLSAQSANQRAFNLNNQQVDEDLSRQFSHQVALENRSASTTPFNPTLSHPSHQSTGSQPHVPRFEQGFDITTDHATRQLLGLGRPSMERASPVSSYRLDTGFNRIYPQASNQWSSRTSSRDARGSDLERRVAAQQYAVGLSQPFHPNQYPYYNLPAQYLQSLPDAYNHNFRHLNASPYGVQSLQTDFAPAGGFGHHSRPTRSQEPGKGHRSALLDEFRQDHKAEQRYELKDLANHVVEFSGDQHGSRHIQKKLSTANSDDKELVFAEIETNAVPLMMDVFGNYVVQKFFEYGSQVQKSILAEKIKGKMMDLSMQVYACRVVQKALQFILVEQQAELAKELEAGIMDVIKDQNGNHVVQKVIELVPRQHLDFIMNAIRSRVMELATHTYGCRVIQRMLEHGTESDKAEIMNELHSSAQVLIMDTYGNYVAQHVIENGNAEDREKMFGLVLAQLLDFARHKYASNVVEKCIECGSPEQRTGFRERLTTPGSDGISPLQQTMRDQFGNYVIQKFLKELHGTEREAFVEDVRPILYTLKKMGSSKQLAALEKLLGLGESQSSARPHGGAETNSTAPTPVLTNEPNSPQSSNSPPSTNASAVGVPTVEGVVKKPQAQTNGTLPQVEVNDS